MANRSRELFHHDINICMEISSDIRREMSMQYAVENHWPMDINFVQLGPRVIKMHTELVDILRFKDLLQQSLVWQAFMKKNPDPFLFSRKLELQQANIVHARPG
jgi:hypothetical protein